MPGGAPAGLESCLVCGRDFVSMVRCTRAADRSWWLRLRCGSCGTWHETFAQDEAVAALQRANRRSRAELTKAVRRLDLERMGSEIEAFSQALELDLISADDF